MLAKLLNRIFPGFINKHSFCFSTILQVDEFSGLFCIGMGD